MLAILTQLGCGPREALTYSKPDLFDVFAATLTTEESEPFITKYKGVKAELVWHFHGNEASVTVNVGNGAAEEVYTFYPRNSGKEGQAKFEVMSASNNSYTAIFLHENHQQCLADRLQSILNEDYQTKILFENSAQPIHEMHNPENVFKAQSMSITKPSISIQELGSITEKYTNLKEIAIDALLPEGYEAFPLRYQVVYLKRNQFGIDDLKTMKCCQLTLQTTNFTEKDLNMFIKWWIDKETSGGIASFLIRTPKLWSVEDLTDGISAKPFDATNNKEKMAGRYGSVSFKHKLDIERSDGTQASLFFGDGQFWFRVWRFDQDDVVEEASDVVTEV